MYDVTIPIPSCASGKDVCIVCVSVCLYRYRHWMVYDRVLQKRFQLPLVATTKSIDFENSPTVGGNDRTSAAWAGWCWPLLMAKLQNMWHCEEAGISEEKCYFAYWPPNEKAEQFLCCRRKMFIRAAASLKLPSVRTAALQHCSQGVNLEEQELVICDNLKVCRVFIQESQIVLLV